MSLQLNTYCDLLYGVEPEGSYIEMRAIVHTCVIAREFFPVHDVGLLESAIHDHSPSADVYLGAAPRCRQEGTRGAVRRSHVLWVDLDTPDAMAALESFTPEPSMVVNSGRGRHAYWGVSPAVSPDTLEWANRRLAHHLGGDMNATDAARVLRPPGSINHKPSGGVVSTAVEDRIEIYQYEYVIGDLRDPEPERPPRLSGGRRLNGDDPLLKISPVIYVEELLGSTVGRDGKVSCPFPGHRNGDRTPSLHVYETPERGWYCHGCRRGGSIYDLAAEIAGVEPRGERFIALAQCLRERFV